MRAYFLGPAAGQVQGKADADGTLNVNDPTARSTLASILAQLDITQSALRDALTSPAPNARTLADLHSQLAAILGQLNLTTTALRDAITGAAPSSRSLFQVDQDLVAALQATQPRNVTNFPADPPDALAQARLFSILSQLDIALSVHRDALLTALAADQPRHVTNFPADYPDAVSQARLLSILTQLDRTLSEVFDVKSSQGAVTAAANNAGLTVTLDLGATGRTTVQRFISVGGASTVLVQASRDGVTWRTMETQTFAVASTSIAAVQGLGYRFIRVTSGTTGVALEFELSGAR
jgi:hypothetical protein